MSEALADTKALDAEILRQALCLSGSMRKRALLMGDVSAVAAYDARLEQWLALRHDIELEHASDGNDCFFCIAAELDADAIALKEGLR